MTLTVQILRDNNKKRNCKCICIAYTHIRENDHHSTQYTINTIQFTRAQRKSTIKRKEIEGKVVENWMLRFYYSQRTIHKGTHRYHVTSGIVLCR